MCASVNSTAIFHSKILFYISTLCNTPKSWKKLSMHRIRNIHLMVTSRSILNILVLSGFSTTLTVYSKLM